MPKPGFSQQPEAAYALIAATKLVLCIATSFPPALGTKQAWASPNRSYPEGLSRAVGTDIFNETAGSPMSGFAAPIHNTILVPSIRDPEAGWAELRR
jgi:hypothetical protein